MCVKGVPGIRKVLIDKTGTHSKGAKSEEWIGLGCAKEK